MRNDVKLARGLAVAVVSVFLVAGAAFAAETAISRKEFGLNWNGLIETGGVVVGDKVKVALNVAAVRRE